MTTDISGFGFTATVVADVTFPSGFEVSEFADDQAPLDIPTVTIGGHALGLNGGGVSWSQASTIPLTFNIIPGSDDDTNLKTLFEANRVGAGKSSAQDSITITLAYPDGSVVTYTGGKCISFPPDPGIANSGRKNSRAYAFSFENRSES